MGYTPFSVFRLSLLFLTAPYTVMYAQSSAFQVADSAINLMDAGHYTEGVRHIERIPRTIVDPGDWIVVAQYAYINNDTTLFFDLMEHLVRQHGFYPTRQHQGLAYYQSIVDGKYASRFRSICDRDMPDFWIRKASVIDRIRTLDEMRIRDQLRGDVNRALEPFDGVTDICSKQLIGYVDDLNFRELMGLCRTGGFPNSFDLHFSATSTAYLILWHNCADSLRFMEKWEQVWPYLDAAYAEGKINNAFVITYDYFLARYQGYQLYGTVPGATIKDEERLAERRAKYGLFE